MTLFLSMNFFRTYGVWLLLPILGVFFGALASSANPLVIGLGIASFVGILLLEKPLWNIEIIIIFGLLAGFMPLFFDDLANKMMWGISILGFVLLISVLYRLITIPKLINSTPAFIWIALLFFVYAITESVLQIYSAKEVIGGFKRYYQAWGLLLALCWMSVDEKNIDRWRNEVLVICLLQTPFCLYEKLVLVPMRATLVESHPGMEPIDVVSGTFGASLLGGGNNAEMATVLIMVFGFLLSRQKEKILSVKKLFRISSILLAPLFMGETKIMVLIFPLVLATLYRKDLLTRPHYLVIASIVGSLFVMIALQIYAAMSNSSVDEIIFGTIRYNVQDIGYGNCSLNRTTVLTFWAQHQGFADPLSFLFGNGLGSAEEGDGHIDVRYPMYCIGLTGASKMLWEVGTLGIGLFLLMLVLAWRCAGQLVKLSANAMVRADAAAIQANIFVFAVYPLYRNTLFSALSFQIIFSAMLGYLAWLHRQQNCRNYER